jgi:hypothetical protein
MKAQRELQEAKPLDERLHIGGEIRVLALDIDGAFSHEVAYEFEDYRELIKEIPAEMI